MKIDRVQVVSNEECYQRSFCFYCKKPGHRLAECSTILKGRKIPRPKTRTGMNDSILETSNDVDDAIVYDQYTINTVQANAESYSSSMLRKQRTINGTPVTILLDCGASTNFIRPGLITKVVSTQQTN